MCAFRTPHWHAQAQSSTACLCLNVPPQPRSCKAYSDSFPCADTQQSGQGVSLYQIAASMELNSKLADNSSIAGPSELAEGDSAAKPAKGETGLSVKDLSGEPAHTEMLH